MHRHRAALLLLTLLATPACAASSEPSTPALARKLVREQGALLLDVRSPAEFESGHVDGATLLPHDQVAARIEEIDGWLDGDRSKPIVVYCRSGNRSGKAKKTLEDAGFTQVVDLGAMSSWCEDC